MFGLTRGEILLTMWVFGLVYVAGLLPRLVARLTRDDASSGKR